MHDEIVPGQRWLSEAEPDLGLGLVLDADQRRVTLRFPAAGETRTYARQSAPLSRVAFEPGDRIEDQAGKPATVVEVLEKGGVLSYRVSDSLGSLSLLPEREVNPRMRLSRPREKLLAGRLDDDVWFDLRRRSWDALALAGGSQVYGLGGARVGLIPHQLYIAAEVSARHAPRVLLADEVGLGKTIEAGLILHRLLLTGRVRRTLILVPGALVHQWLVEMRRRFHLHFALYDAERVRAMGEGNPFHAEQKVLCSLEFLTGDAGAARSALNGDWDLLIVDEAHHLYWSENESSLAYDFVQALAGQTPGVLLLTATPEQLGRAGHFGRLRLLDPDRFHDYQAFLREEREYAPVGRLAASLLDGLPLDAAQLALLRDLLGEDLVPEDAVAALLDRHGTGRVLFRNTRAAIQGFPGRELLTHALPRPPAYPATGDDPLGLLTPELALGEGWADSDPRVPWLVNTLRALRPQKLLVICASAGTARQLADWLHAREGIHAGLFHEGMSILERDRAAAYFADPEGTRLLICSEIGSEGRNFQFAHHLVLFDLPLEPDLLEQRIGRLDRIGQSETVHIHVPLLQGGAGERLFLWYRDGLGAFQGPCPAAAGVFEELAPDLLAALAADQGMQVLVRRAAERTRRLNAELESGRDRLLELHSHRPREAGALAAAILQGDRDPALWDYLTRYWDAFGVEHEPGPGASTVLRPGPHMRHDNFPGLPGDGLTITFDRADALAHEDRDFMTWEHPMARDSLDLLVTDDLGSAAFSLVQHPDFPAGTPLLELLFVVECPAPEGLQANRFLPPAALRLLLDAQGANLADRLPPVRLQGRCLARERKLAFKLLEHLKGKLEAMIEQGRAMAEAWGESRTADAMASMRRDLDGELQRLRYLSKVNPNVRADEIEHLVLRREALTHYLGDARVRLDALRLVVMS